jgi:hypothetical protein
MGSAPCSAHFPGRSRSSVCAPLERHLTVLVRPPGARSFELDERIEAIREVIRPDEVRRAAIGRCRNHSFTPMPRPPWPGARSWSTSC